jgi:hypothetical protein
MKQVTWWDLMFWANIVIVSCANSNALSIIGVCFAVSALVISYFSRKE